MGLTKQYLRYVPRGLFNLIGSGRGGGVYLDQNNPDLAAVAAAQDVVIWDLKKKEKLRVLSPGEKFHYEVTSIASNKAGSLVAVGYTNGCIKLFDTATGDSEVTFSGHKNDVTCISFDDDCMRLVSGSKDACIIVWDIVSESGLYKLHGHKGPVTAVKFMQSDKNLLVSSSKDTFIKFWDLSNQHCFKTITGHVTEIWDLVLLEQDTLLVTGGSDTELKVWRLEFLHDLEDEDKTGFIKKDNSKKMKVEDKEDKKDDKDDEDSEEQDDDTILSIKKIGTILRNGEGRLLNIAVDQNGRVLACHGTDNSVEVFLVCTPEEVKKRLAKKARKENKRTGEEMNVDEMKATVQEQFRRIKPGKVSGKIKSMSVSVHKGICRILMVLANNQIEIVKCDLSVAEREVENGSKIEMLGHKSNVKTLAFSSDNTAMMTASAEGVKVWNRASLNCVRTMPCGNALSCLFAPGDRHALVGTKSGAIQIFDIGSGEMTEEIAAHNGEVWSLVLSPDGKCVMSGSGDKTVKLWDFELITSEQQDTKILSILHTRTLQLDEGVTCVCVSADNRLIAVGLLDSTVKVFFIDTLKFFLCLYGHKLPVVCMDISSDSTLIATGSGDRNMKIWGLDFGDCHKSVFAHDDTITGLKFLPNTHQMFTCGKDGQVKHWDADNFERIITLKGHLGEVWTLAISPNGKWVVSSGKDRAIRLWEKSQEIVVLEDERETEREDAAEDDVGESQPVPGEQGKETSLPSKRNVETEKGAEALMEGIELYYETVDSEETQLPPLMLAYGAETCLDFMSGVISRIKHAQLEETLLVLPLDVVHKLLNILLKLLQEHVEVEIVSRCLLFLLEIHHGPILANPSFQQTIRQLESALGSEITRVRELAGTNLAGLRYLAARLKEREDVELFVDATLRVRAKNKKKKNKEKALQRAVLSL